MLEGVKHVTLTRQNVIKFYKIIRQTQSKVGSETFHPQKEQKFVVQTFCPCQPYLLNLTNTLHL
jgi:hypothetical protein